MRTFRFWEEATVFTWMYKNSPSSVLHRLDQDIYEEIKDARERLSVLKQFNTSSRKDNKTEAVTENDEVKLLLVYKKAVRIIIRNRQTVTAKNLVLTCSGQNVSVSDNYKTLMIQWYQRRERASGCSCATGISVIQPLGNQI
jgi:hypothetical protein